MSGTLAEVLVLVGVGVDEDCVAVLWTNFPRHIQAPLRRRARPHVYPKPLEVRLLQNLVVVRRRLVLEVPFRVLARRQILVADGCVAGRSGRAGRRRTRPRQEATPRSQTQRLLATLFTSSFQAILSSLILLPAVVLMEFKRIVSSNIVFGDHRTATGAFPRSSRGACSCYQLFPVLPIIIVFALVNVVLVHACRRLALIFGIQPVQLGPVHTLKIVAVVLVEVLDLVVHITGASMSSLTSNVTWHVVPSAHII